MKWGILCLFLTAQAWALTPVLNDYGSKESVYTEFRNLYDNAQARVTVVSSTPNAIDMSEGDIWVYQSSANVKDLFLFLRIGTTVYGSVNFPIIKVR